MELVHVAGDVEVRYKHGKARKPLRSVLKWNLSQARESTRCLQCPIARGYRVAWLHLLP